MSTPLFADQAKTNMRYRSAGNATDSGPVSFNDFFGANVTGPPSPQTTTTLPAIVSVLPAATVSIVIDRSSYGASEWCALAVDNAINKGTVRGFVDGNIPLQFVDPDGFFSESSSPSYSTHQPMGRHEPMRAYAGNGLKAISLRGVYRAQTKIGLDVLRDVAGMFDALRYPMRTAAGRWLPPPTLIVTVPAVLRMPARLVNLGVTWGGGIHSESQSLSDATFEQLSLDLSLQSAGAVIGTSVSADGVDITRGYAAGAGYSPGVASVPLRSGATS